MKRQVLEALLREAYSGRLSRARNSAAPGWSTQRSSGFSRKRVNAESRVSFHSSETSCLWFSSFRVLRQELQVDFAFFLGAVQIYVNFFDHDGIASDGNHFAVVNADRRAELHDVAQAGGIFDQCIGIAWVGDNTDQFQLSQF